MAQVETWKSRGGPPTVTNPNVAEYPYYLGGDSRAMAQAGDKVADVGFQMWGRATKEQTAQELSDLDVSQITAWSDYANWAHTNPNTPDVKLEEFDRQEAKWRKTMTGGLQTNQAKKVGGRAYDLWIDAKRNDARLMALNQERVNTKATFEGNLVTLENIPDQPYFQPGKEIYERMGSISEQHEIAAAAGVDGLNNNEPAKQASLLRSYKRLWTNGILNAMKYDPASLAGLMSDEANPLDVHQKARLDATWRATQESARITKDKNTAAMVDVNTAQTWTKVLQTSRGALQGNDAATPIELERKMASGEIDLVQGRMMWDRLTVKNATVNEASHLKAYGVMSLAKTELRLHPETISKYNATLQEQMPFLTDAEGIKFIEEKGSTELTMRDMGQSEAAKMATKILRPLAYFDSANDPKVVDEEKMTVAMGEVAYEFDKWMNAKFKPDQRPSEDELRQGALDTVLRIRDKYVPAVAPSKGNSIGRAIGSAVDWIVSPVTDFSGPPGTYSLAAADAASKMFPDYWSGWTRDERVAVSKMLPAKQQRLLEELKKKKQAQVGTVVITPIMPGTGK